MKGESCDKMGMEIYSGTKSKMTPKPGDARVMQKNFIKAKGYNPAPGALPGTTRMGGGKGDMGAMAGKTIG